MALSNYLLFFYNLLSDLSISYLPSIPILCKNRRLLSAIPSISTSGIHKAFRILMCQNNCTYIYAEPHKLFHLLYKPILSSDEALFHLQPLFFAHNLSRALCQAAASLHIPPEGSAPWFPRRYSCPVQISKIWHKERRLWHGAVRLCHLHATPKLIVAGELDPGCRPEYGDLWIKESRGGRISGKEFQALQTAREKSGDTWGSRRPSCCSGWQNQKDIGRNLPGYAVEKVERD